MMRAIWTDEDGDTLELFNVNENGDEMDSMVLRLSEHGEYLFAFTPDDAESFAAHLRAWALRQREGV
jgi:hypothetical protein